MLSKEGNNGTTLNNNTIFNPFEALFGSSNSSSSSSGGERNHSGTGLGFFNNNSIGNDSLNPFMISNIQSNETIDILKLLELLQGSGNGGGSNGGGSNGGGSNGGT